MTTKTLSTAAFLGLLIIAVAYDAIPGAVLFSMVRVTVAIGLGILIGRFIGRRLARSVGCSGVRN